jgi:DNA-directed RNA polymerase II subunit RPB11
MDITFENQDHTIGNLLQQNLSIRPEVKFVGYIMPHPLEKLIKLRIETHEPGQERKILSDTIQNIVNELDNISKECKEKFKIENTPV